MMKVINYVLALLVFILIVIIGLGVGKHFAGGESNPKKTLNVIKEEKTSTIIEYKLVGKTDFKDLCEKDTGLCEGNFGYVKLNNNNFKFDLYINFDNPNNKSINYMKLNNTKIGNFHTLVSVQSYNDKYLIITEVNKNNEIYNIYIYNEDLKQVKHYESIRPVIYSIDQNTLSYDVCEEEELYEYKIDLDNEFNEEVINKEKAC